MTWMPDYETVDTMLRGETDLKIKFSELIDYFLSGQFGLSIRSIGTILFDYLFQTINEQWDTIIELAGLGIISAVFTTLAYAFSKKQVVETGFYVSYILLFSSLSIGFSQIIDIAGRFGSQLLNFMKVIIPIFVGILSVVLGITSANIWHQLLLLILLLVEWMISGAMTKIIYAYVILAMTNQMTDESYFSKMCELIKSGICWSLKSIQGCILGLNLLQGMIYPAFDTVKKGMLTKVTTMIPGIGDAMSTAAKTVIGSGILLKNAIGVSGVIIICLIGSVPLIKLGMIGLMYRVLAALLQPVSDARFATCIHIVSDGIFMLFKLCTTLMFIFIISLTVMTCLSNIAMQ